MLRIFFCKVHGKTSIILQLISLVYDSRCLFYTYLMKHYDFSPSRTRKIKLALNDADPKRTTSPKKHIQSTDWMCFWSLLFCSLRYHSGLLIHQPTNLQKPRQNLSHLITLREAIRIKVTVTLTIHDASLVNVFDSCFRPVCHLVGIIEVC